MIDMIDVCFLELLLQKLKTKYKISEMTLNCSVQNRNKFRIKNI